jgi:hypothetical protein
MWLKLMIDSFQTSFTLKKWDPHWVPIRTARERLKKLEPQRLSKYKKYLPSLLWLCRTRYVSTTRGWQPKLTNGINEACFDDSAGNRQIE